MSIAKAEIRPVCVLRVVSLILLAFCAGCTAHVPVTDAAPLDASVSRTDGTDGRVPTSVQPLQSTRAALAAALRQAIEAGEEQSIRDLFAAAAHLAETDGVSPRLWLEALNPQEYELVARIVQSEQVDTFQHGPKTTPVASRELPDASMPEASRSFVEREIARLLRTFGQNGSVTIPPAFTRTVEGYLVRFTDPQDLGPWYARAYARMSRHRPMLDRVFADYELPRELHYVALVESAFNTSARSSAGAVGMWQFMPATARQYGLTVNRRRDDRKDPERATRAAAEYLTDLTLDFGDGHSMLLALAAYNAGEGRIRSRLRRLNSISQRSFWGLTNASLLPRETAQYIPKILAAAIIGDNPDRYGLRPQPAPPQQYIALNKPVPVDLLAKEAQVPRVELEQDNPDLVGAVTTPAQTEYKLNVPAKVKQRMLKSPAIKAATEPVEQPTSNSVTENGATLVYRVAANNRWHDISRWSGISEAKLRRDNKQIHPTYLLKGKPLYLHGVSDDLERHLHVVENGESLSEIADLYGTSINLLKMWNGRGGSRIYRGETLTLYIEPTSIASSASTRRKPSVVFTVQQGNTLGSIARAFGTTPSKLRELNGVKGNRIYPGQKLKIPSRAWDRFDVRVKPRDTLGKIAARYGVPVRSVMTFNGMRSSRIYVGERLVVYKRS